MNRRQRKKQASKRYGYWNGRVRGTRVYRFRYYRMWNGEIYLVYTAKPKFKADDFNRYYLGCYAPHHVNDVLGAMEEREYERQHQPDYPTRLTWSTRFGLL